VVERIRVFTTKLTKGTKKREGFNGDGIMEDSTRSIPYKIKYQSAKSKMTK